MYTQNQIDCLRIALRHAQILTETNLEALKRADPMENDVEYLFDEKERLEAIVDVLKVYLGYLPRQILIDTNKAFVEDAKMLYCSIVRKYERNA